jgi:acetyltransferase-like isoleucine patch superfamily enzyme
LIVGAHLAVPGRDTRIPGLMSSRSSRVVDQLYFLGLAAINTIHGLLPFVLRPLLYKVCRFDIDRSATLQGGVRFFHVGRLSVGEGTLVNRGVYLDNRAGIRIGRQVSIAHDTKIYTMGHDPHDETFATKGQEVRIDDYAVVFAGAMIMPGVHLGEGSVVMAGSVVTKSVPPYRMVGGNPAVDIGERRGTPKYRLDRRFWLAH